MAEQPPLLPGREPAASYSRLAVTGGAAAVAAQAVKLVANLAVLLVVGTQLTPDELGLSAIALFALAGLAALTDVGLRDAILSSTTAEQDRGLGGLACVAASVAAGVTAVGAPVVALLAGDQRAAGLILALAPVAGLQVLVTAQEGFYRRALAFRALTGRATVALLLGTGTAVVAALAGAGPWALLLQPSVEHAVSVVLLAAGPVRPVRPSFRREHFRGAWEVARSLTGTAAILFAYTNLDDLVVARLAGTSALGRYNLAYRVTNAPVYMFTHGTGVVLAPILRRLATGSPARVGPAYLRQLRVIAWASAVSLAGLAIFGPALVERLFNDRWEGVDVTLRILAGYGLVRAVGATTGSVFVATGQFWMIRRLAKWPLVAMLVAIVPCVLAWGTAGAAAAVTLPLAVATAFSLAASARAVKLRPAHVYRAVLGPWALAVAASVAAVVAGRASGGVDGDGLWVGLGAYALVSVLGAIPMLRSFREVLAERPSPPAPSR